MQKVKKLILFFLLLMSFTSSSFSFVAPDPQISACNTPEREELPYSLPPYSGNQFNEIFDTIEDNVSSINNGCPMADSPVDAAFLDLFADLGLVESFETYSCNSNYSYNPKITDSSIQQMGWGWKKCFKRIGQGIAACYIIVDTALCIDEYWECLQQAALDQLCCENKYGVGHQICEQGWIADGLACKIEWYNCSWPL